MHFGDVTSLRKEFRVWNGYLVDDRIFVSARLMTDEIRPKHSMLIKYAAMQRSVASLGSVDTFSRKLTV